MPTIKSLDDLSRIREEVLKKHKLVTTSGKTEIIVSMGTVSRATGAQEILTAILSYIEEHNLENIVVRQTGDIGLDSFEPIIQIILPGEKKVTYGKVNPEIVKSILSDHVIGGKIIEEFKVER